MESILDPTMDPRDLRVGETDIANAVFIIPNDAPVPVELTAAISVGNLLARLVPIGEQEHESTTVVPVSGTELLALVPAWKALCVAKRVYALHGLPGARYDVPFTLAAKQIGLRRLDWDDVAEAVTRRDTSVQRAKDKSPWLLGDRAAQPSAPAGFPRRRGTVDGPLRPPVELTEEDDL